MYVSYANLKHLRLFQERYKVMVKKDRSYNVMELSWNFARSMEHPQSKCNYVALIATFLYFYYAAIVVLLLQRPFAVNCYFVLDLGLLSPGFSWKVRNLEKLHNVKLTILPS